LAGGPPPGHESEGGTGLSEKINLEQRKKPAEWVQKRKKKTGSANKRKKPDEPTAKENRQPKKRCGPGVGYHN